MSGNKEPLFNYQSIVYSDFFVNPNFLEQSSVKQDDFGWLMPIDFKIIKRKQFWDNLSIDVTLTLVRNSDQRIISKLKITSTYQVTAGMSFAHKFESLNILINATMGHLQGGWIDKHSKSWIKDLIPQILFSVGEISGPLKKRVYERWD